MYVGRALLLVEHGQTTRVLRRPTIIIFLVCFYAENDIEE
jgi:hypothetical protein